MSNREASVAKPETSHADGKTKNKEESQSPKEQKQQKQPMTPERPARSEKRIINVSSSNIGNELSPRTPPSSRKLAQLINQSPTVQNNEITLPPGTPFENSNRHNKLSNVPITPHSAGRLPVRPDLIEDNSPLKSPSSLNHYDDDEKPPIRQISSTLKTRLSYAMVKLQNGWSNQSLDELEKNMKEEGRSSNGIKGSLLTSPSMKSSKTSPSKVSKIQVSPNRRVEAPNFNRYNHRSINDDGSANTAFLRAMSKSRSPKMKINHKPLPSLKLDQSSLNASNNPEADAIETLMSLASPQSFKPNLASPSHSLASFPRQKLTFGEKLHEASKDDTGDETDVEVETELEESEDEKMEKASTIDEDAARTEDEDEDEDEDVRTASDPDSL